MAQIGDILAKLGRRETLTTAEQQQIRLWGNQTQINSSFISGLQNGMADLNVRSINGIDSFFVKTSSVNNATSERSVTLIATQSMPNNSYAGMYGYAEVTNDGYTYNGSGSIFVPENGTYSLSASYTFSDSADSDGYRGGYIRLDGTYASFTRNVIPFLGIDTNFILSGQMAALAGSYFTVVVFQNSGAAMNVSIRTTIRKIR